MANKQLSYRDARDWCHSQNSYLATVSDPNTANLLASYAHTTANFNSNNFWIGLSRSNSTSKYTWDSGYPLGWTNFNIQNGETFVAESVTNAKWNTFGVDAKFNFVCSYDPKAPPTFASPYPTESTESVSVETTTLPDYTNCTPSSPFIFLFAYSNDFSPDIVNTILRSSIVISHRFSLPVVSKLANIRFDVRVEEEIQFHDDFSSFNVSVLQRLPDPSLGFNDTTTGSDVLNMLRRFLKTSVAPVCGARVMLLTKRQSAETEYKNLIADLQRQHIVVQTASSWTSFGNMQNQGIYDVSAQTNGFCGFAHDDQIPHFTSTMLSAFFYMGLIYSVNPVVEGNGTILLPPVPVPSYLPISNSGNAFFLVNVNNYATVETCNQFELHFMDAHGNDYYSFERVHSQDSTLFSHQFNLSTSSPYSTLSIDYDYSGNEKHSIEVRIYVYSQQSTWPPFYQ